MSKIAFIGLDLKTLAIINGSILKKDLGDGNCIFEGYGTEIVNSNQLRYYLLGIVTKDGMLVRLHCCNEETSIDCNNPIECFVNQNNDGNYTGTWLNIANNFVSEVQINIRKADYHCKHKELIIQEVENCKDKFNDETKREIEEISTNKRILLDRYNSIRDLKVDDNAGPQHVYIMSK